MGRALSPPLFRKYPSAEASAVGASEVELAIIDDSDRTPRCRTAATGIESALISLRAGTYHWAGAKCVANLLAGLPRTRGKFRRRGGSLATSAAGFI